MNSAKILSSLAIGLTLIGVALLTLLDTQLTSLDYISRLNEIEAQYQSFSNGLFVLIGIFWMGTVDTTRRAIEPEKLSPWLRYGSIAFAASYLLSMVFPCDAGCPPTGSLNQMVHSSLVWLLYAGPAVWSVSIIRAGDRSLLRGVAWGLVSVFGLMQVDTLFVHVAPGLWQRLYDALFCLLWWLNLRQLEQAKVGRSI